MSTRGKVIAALLAVAASVLLLLFSGLYLGGEHRYYSERKAAVVELAHRTQRFANLFEGLPRPGVEASVLAEESSARVQEFDKVFSGLAVSMQGAEGAALTPVIDKEWVALKKDIASAVSAKASEDDALRRCVEGLERMGSSIEELSVLIDGRLLELASLQKRALVASSLFSTGALFLAGVLISGRIFRPLSIVRQSLDSMATVVPGLDAGNGGDDEPGVIIERLKRFNLSYTELLNRYHDVMDASPVAAFELDDRGKISTLNSAAEGLLGYRKSDILDRPFRDLITGKNRREFERLLADLSKGTRRGGLALDISRKDGSAGRVGLKVLALMGPNGFRGAVVFARDLEETGMLTKELKAVRSEAEMTSRTLKDNIRDLEDFALMAVRRELKMKEIREMLKKFNEERESKKGYRH